MATASRIAAKQAKALESNTDKLSEIIRQLNRMEKKLARLLAAMPAEEAEKTAVSSKKGK